MKPALASIGLFISQKRNRSLFIGCTIVLMLVSFLTQIYQVYRATSDQPALSGEIPQPKEELAQLDVFNIEDFPLLFGFSDKTQETSQDEKDIPETRLNLVLRGAIAGDGSQTSSAIIEEGGSSEQLYFIGESLPGGATLAQINNDHIVINRNGMLEKLYFPGFGAEALLTEVENEVKPESEPTPPTTEPSSKQEEAPKNLEERMHNLREQLHQADKAWQP